MPLDPEAAEYLGINPLTADATEISEDEFVSRVRESRELPENIRRSLSAQETSDLIRKIVRTHTLTPDQLRQLVSVIREVFFGNESAGMIKSLLEQKLALEPPRAQSIAREITNKLITPNYFQIAQVYEKKHGRPTTGTATARGALMSGAAGSGQTLSATGNGQSAVGTTSSTDKPPRVVDLRNGGMPNQLPPAPTDAGDVGGRVSIVGDERQTAPPTPPSPKPTLSPPSPPPFQRPAGGGEHGPVPLTRGEGTGDRV